jgi:hypothetical protein
MIVDPAAELQSTYEDGNDAKRLRSDPMTRSGFNETSRPWVAI